MRKLVLSVLLLLAPLALAHETRTVGPEDGRRYQLVVGMLNEPVFTELRTGLDLRVTDAADGAPVEGLENSLQVTLGAPGGETRTLAVQPRHGQPGHYTDAYVLTVPGTYDIRIRGFIGDLEIDETFPREVGDVSGIRFP